MSGGGLSRAPLGYPTCVLADVDMDASDSAEALEKCTTIELREILARSVARANRVQSALDARTADVPYPSRLPPALVLAFLPICELPHALRVSTLWREQAEEVFRGIAARLQLTRSSPSWREVVRDNTSNRWLPVAFSESLQPVQFDMNCMVLPRVIDSRYPDDNTMFFGQSALINDNETLRWELNLGRDRHDLEIIDSCGLAIIDDGRFVNEAAFDPNVLLHAYIWHSDGGDYTIGGEEPSSFIPVPIDIDDGEHAWDPLAMVRLTAVRRGIELQLHLSVLGEDHDGDWRYLQGRRQFLQDWSSRIRIAPFVSLYTGSRAELLRFRRLAGSGL